jgi:hypothetical protein
MPSNLPGLELQGKQLDFPQVLKIRINNPEKKSALIL